VLLSVDAKSRQLMAIAPPEQQERIRETIERLQTAPRQFEVFQLEVIEPQTAELAIEKLFSDTGGVGRSGNAPIVDSDAAAQRLYVRASQEQLEQIRELLVKMGEVNLATTADAAARGVRVVQFSGDTKAALAEIERVWPRLSNHPLRILQPRDLSPKLLPKLQKDSDRAIPKRGAVENPAEPLPEKDDAGSGLNKQTRVVPPAAEVLEVKTAATDEPAEQPAASDERGKKDAVDEERSPIIVAPGDDKITIMSDDPEAIKQLEALLRTLSPPSGSGGRDIMVFPLHSASSSAVADILQKIFRRASTGFGDSSPVAIAADQRLNAIVVYGGRNDRGVIERLLKTLDSEDVPESLVANRPSLIPVKNTQAALVVQMLKDVYKTQLTSGGVKQPIPVPSGASLEVAAVIQQINTAAAGPLMTLGVDETTNSIVIMAPGPLVKEVTDLVRELDDAALNDSSRGVRIVKLKSTSAQRVKEILDVLIKDALKRKGTAVRP
jgi:type II secretory pathway component GspD/PulD (secretin)